MSKAVWPADLLLWVNWLSSLMALSILSPSRAIIARATVIASKVLIVSDFSANHVSIWWCSNQWWTATRSFSANQRRTLQASRFFQVSLNNSPLRLYSSAFLRASSAVSICPCAMAVRDKERYPLTRSIEIGQRSIDLTACIAACWAASSWFHSRCRSLNPI